MKKVLRSLLFIFLGIIILFVGFMIYAFSISAGVKLDKKKLIDFDNKISICTLTGEIIDEEVNSKKIVESNSIPKHLKNAFVAIEDKRFYKHNGVDYKGLIRATVKNTISLSFKEGASTISQQLIKNTHLNGKKNLTRKIQEIALAKKLEKEYSKDEILTSYLNTIYFGENCFGISNAAKRYFSKEVKDLTINESAVLAGLIKSPSAYSPTKNEDACFNRKNIVLKCMYQQGYITEEQYKQNKNKTISLNLSENKSEKNYVYLVNKELDELLLPLSRYGKKLTVYTYYDTEKQNVLEDCLSEYDLETDKSGIILNNESKVLAYYSSIGEIKRQLGSIIKPLVVYGPAIETDTVCELTPILDEKTDFNGYSPSNYNDKYYGYVSVKESLSKSLNVPAVKILNSTGIKKSLFYLNKTAIKTDVDDQNLSLALGATKYGSTLKEVVSSYSVFQNDGNYIESKCINKIVDENGKVLYNDKTKKTKVFSEETAYIVNDMLNYCVENGTAKKLSFLSFPIYAKTGTVGNRDGNIDAYTVSYNKDYSVGIWLGNRNNSIMDNKITGGSFPSKISYDIWDEFYRHSCPPTKFSSEKVKEIPVDKLSYENDHKILVADSNVPSRYVIYGLFKKTDIPQSKSITFSMPTVDNVILSVKHNQITISLCLKEYYDARVYKVFDGKKTLVFDTHDTKLTNFIDTDILPDNVYEYIVVPYYSVNDKEFIGKEYYVKKIKTPAEIVGDDWWIDYDETLKQISFNMT